MATTTPLEPGRETQFPALKEGEVSPCKIMACIIIREHFMYPDFKTVTPGSRIDAAFFLYRLITMRDVSFKEFVVLCLRHDTLIDPEIILSFLHIIDGLYEGTPLFFHELFNGIIDDIVDSSSSRTLLLRKGVSKGSPIGKFVRLVSLSIRKMSYPQVSYLYKQFWAYLHKDDLDCLRIELDGILPEALPDEIRIDHLEQHPPCLRAKAQPKPGLDRFYKLMHRRAKSGRTGLGPSYSGLPGKISSPATKSKASISTPPVNKKVVIAKWHGRKMIDRTLRTLSSSFYTSGTTRYTPRQISTFLDAVRHNPTSEPMYPKTHFLDYLNSIQLKDYSRCSNSLRTTFDLKKRVTGSELNKAYAAYNFALLNDFFGFREDSLTTLNEAFQASHVCADQKCLHYCNHLWAAMESIPYKGCIVKTQLTKRMHKALSYMHSFNVISESFSLHSEGGKPIDVFNSIWRVTTGLDFENTESLLLIALGNLFSILGDNESVGFVSEVLLNTAHVVKWPLRSYASALTQISSSALMSAEVSYAEALLHEYAENIFKFDASVAGELFAKHKAICKATRSFLARKLVDESVIATILAFDPLESHYWNAYNKVLRQDWPRSEKLISHLWDSLKVKSCENSDMIIRILILEAEICCANETPTGALQRLFEAHELAVKLSADFYIMLCQLGICSIQIFLGLPSTARKTLNRDTLVKCRAACNFLRAKLCILTAKLALHQDCEIPSSGNVGTTDMDVAETIALFKGNGGNKYKHKQPKIPKKSRKVPVATEQFDELRDKFVTKMERLLDYADVTFQQFGNDYLRYEALYLKRDLYTQYSNSMELDKVETQISRLPRFDIYESKRICII